MYPSAGNLIKKDEWVNLLSYKKARENIERTASKVKVAWHYVSNSEVDFEVFDLKARVAQLCDFIAKLNGYKI